MFISLRPCTYVMGSNVNLGSFGVIVVKFWFSLKMYYLFYILLSIFMLFIHLHHICGINRETGGQSGVNVSKPAGYAVCDGNMSSSSLPCRRSRRVLYLTRFFLSFFFLYPAGAAAGSCIWLVSSFFFLSFFLLSSGNTSKTYSFNMPWPISTKLGHKNPWPMALMSYDHSGVKGHVGVIGVKKLIS